MIVHTSSVAAFEGQIGQARLRGHQGRRGRHDAADRARARDVRHPRACSLAPGIFGTPDAGRHAAGGAGLARQAGALSAAPRPARGIRRAWCRPSSKSPISTAKPSASTARSACSRNEPMSNPGPAQRDVMEYDVAVVGAGPAGLATAIRLKQLQPGAHGLRPREGIDARRAHHCPAPCSSPGRSMRCCPSGAARRCRSACRSRAMSSAGWAGTARAACRGFRSTLRNEGNFIISLGGLVQWLAHAGRGARHRRVRGFRRRAAAVR